MFRLPVRVANREKAWLSMVIDDYRHVVAGYLPSFQPPSPLHTSLAMHVTSTDVLYTDHVSDFTFRHLERVGGRGSQDSADLFDGGKSARLLRAELDNSRDIRGYADYLVTMTVRIVRRLMKYE